METINSRVDLHFLLDFWFTFDKLVGIALGGSLGSYRKTTRPGMDNLGLKVDFKVVKS